MSSSETDSQIEETLFEVEDILDKKTINGITYYKIKWLGFPLSESSWEPKSNLDSAPQMINEFEQRLLKQKRNKSTHKQNFKKTKKNSLSKRKDKTDDKSATTVSKVISINLGDEESTEVSDNPKSPASDKKIIPVKSKEHIKIKDLFKLDGQLYAKIEIKSTNEKDRTPIKKDKVVLTKDLYEKAPIKLLEFYEDKIMKNLLNVKSIQ